MVSMLAPSTVAMNTGSRLWMASEDTSINRLTKPSAQMLRGRAGRRGVDGASLMGGKLF